MTRRTIWTIFTLIFMMVGVIAGMRVADMYIPHVNSIGWSVINPKTDQSSTNPAAGKNTGKQTATNKNEERPVSLPEQASLTTKVAFAIAGWLVAVLIWMLIVSEFRRLRRGVESMSPQDKALSLLGILLGLAITALLAISLSFPPIVNLILAVLLCYLSVTVVLSMKEQFRMFFPGSGLPERSSVTGALRPKILDTNVIIDGRIADVCKAGFVEGPIYIPRFVLEELQQIADSSDSLKRARGRRGLDILNQMQQEMSLQVETFEAGNGNSSDEVDARLVILAKELNGAIVTNDFNLNKVAVLQGVKVLNVNELANALKPVVLPGEEMAVLIIKEGKEQNQGIGYLDDGTMIVVERARQHIGETLDVIVTSILQTPAGKMIFAIMKNENEEEEESIERNIRSYSGSRQRRKIR